MQIKKSSKEFKVLFYGSLVVVALITIVLLIYKNNKQSMMKQDTQKFELKFEYQCCSKFK